MVDIKRVADLTPDPRNARKHTPRNVGMVEKALREVGAARSIVIDEDGKILAGNATIEAAAIAGIENVQVVDADGNTIIAVRRSGLSDAQKTKLALYDNRAAELADWDAEVIAAIALEDDGALDGLFSGDELAGITSALRYLDGNGGDRSGASPWDRMSGDGADGVLFSFGTITCKVSQSVYESMQSDAPQTDIAEWVESVIIAGLNH